MYLYLVFLATGLLRSKGDKCQNFTTIHSSDFQSYSEERSHRAMLICRSVMEKVEFEL